MSIERLPHAYPIGSTVHVSWNCGKVISRIGKYHLIWWTIRNWAI
jgi:hypothetical protein